jgi:hypothetical protein
VTDPATKKVILTLLALAALGIGGLGTVALPGQAISAYRTSHGGGKPGTLTLVESLGCDRNRPPKCGWYGDFASDDGTVVRSQLELLAAPESAAAGDNVRARYAGGTVVFLEGDSTGWRPLVAMAVAFFVVFLVGLGATVHFLWPRKRAG